MPKTKRVQRGVLYFGGPEGRVVTVQPANGKKFTYDELSLAVGGLIEPMIPAEPRRAVWVNEEGALLGLPANVNTWKFACRYVYCALNGYDKNWLVSGNALETYLVDDVPGSMLLPTVKETLRLASVAEDARNLRRAYLGEDWAATVARLADKRYETHAGRKVSVAELEALR